MVNLKRCNIVFIGFIKSCGFGALALMGGCGVDEPSSGSSASSVDVISSSALSSTTSSLSSINSSQGDPCAIAFDDFPYCFGESAIADPDGDGWGWENEASCVVPDSSADPNPGTCVRDFPDPGEGTSANRIMYNGQAVYLNGFNVAWFDFARDFGNGVDESRLRQVLQDVSSAGGNSLRWWFHVDGSTTPEWGNVNGQRMVTGPGGSAIADLRRALDIAAQYDVYIIPALWSFDMLRDNDFRNPPNEDNYRLLSDEQVLQSYIDNALTPLVQELNGHEQLFAWELFNEPENMTETWFRNESVYYGGPVPTLEMLQRVQAKMTAAIHRAANSIGQTALVTTGSKSVGKYNSDVAGGFNWYRDDRMIAAADGDPLATLDFYEPHYYNNEGKNGAWSPFHRPVEYWNLNKPVVIGEFYISGSNSPTSVPNTTFAQDDTCKVLEELGYAGGWPWQWNEHAQEMSNCISRVSD